MSDSTLTAAALGVVKHSEAHTAGTYPDIWPSKNGAVLELRRRAQEYFALEFDLAVLENAIENANKAADFESGVDLTASYLTRETEFEAVRVALFALLRKEFS